MGAWSKEKKSVENKQSENGKKFHHLGTDIKRSGILKFCLSVRRYIQAPGDNFSDLHVPMITDVHWRISILALLVLYLSAKFINVETAFFVGDLDEQMYMSCQEVYDKDDLLYLLYSIHSLVQAARQYYEKFIVALRVWDFRVDIRMHAWWQNTQGRNDLHRNLEQWFLACWLQKDSQEDHLGL